MNIYADEIKERVKTRDAAIAYGMRVDHQGWACCPFHRESKPSLRVYGGDRGWHCFGCGAGGSVIDLTMRLHGLTLMAALRKLNEDFALGLPLDVRPDWRARRRIAEETIRRKREALERERAYRWAVEAWTEAFDRWLMLQRWARWYAPAASENPESAPEAFRRELWAYALRELAAARFEAEEAEQAMIDCYPKGGVYA